MFIALVNSHVCAWAPQFCSWSLSEIAGWDSENLNSTLVPVYVQSADTSSILNIAHLLQTYSSNKFRMYDWGKEIYASYKFNKILQRHNLKLYQAASPPEFPLWNITTPISLYYGGADTLVTKEANYKH